MTKLLLGLAALAALSTPVLAEDAASGDIFGSGVIETGMHGVDFQIGVGVMQRSTGETTTALENSSFTSVATTDDLGALQGGSLQFVLDVDNVVMVRALAGSQNSSSAEFSDTFLGMGVPTTPLTVGLFGDDVDATIDRNTSIVDFDILHPVWESEGFELLIGAKLARLGDATHNFLEAPNFPGTTMTVDIQTNSTMFGPQIAGTYSHAPDTGNGFGLDLFGGLSVLANRSTNQYSAIGTGISAGTNESATGMRDDISFAAEASVSGYYQVTDNNQIGLNLNLAQFTNIASAPKSALVVDRTGPVLAGVALDSVTYAGISVFWKGEF